MVISGYHQNVNRMLGRNVVEGNGVLGLGNETCRNVTTGYLAENTVANLLTPLLKVYLPLVVVTQ